jgi:hypothetical protein
MTQQNERAEQTALFAWARYNVTKYPPLQWLFATLNGERLQPGQAARAKAAGMVAGVVDCWLIWPVGDAPGMAFEMKAGHNKPTAEQAEWLAHLAECGWRTGVYYSHEEAAAAIVEYLEGL